MLVKEATRELYEVIRLTENLVSTAAFQSRHLSHGRIRLCSQDLVCLLYMSDGLSPWLRICSTDLKQYNKNGSRILLSDMETHADGKRINEKTIQKLHTYKLSRTVWLLDVLQQIRRGILFTWHWPEPHPNPFPPTTTLTPTATTLPRNHQYQITAFQRSTHA